MDESDGAASSGVQSRTVGSVLVLTLTRPDKGNALRQEDTRALIAEIEAVDGGGELRCILIRAQGKNFCLGADLHAANDVGAKPRIGHLTRSLESGPHRLVEVLWNCRVPTVSAVQGQAVGLGLHLAVVCDFVLAAADARFTEPFSRRGFSADSGGTFLLPRLIGLRRARQMLIRGVKLDATTARDWGLIDEVVDTDDLNAAAEAVSAELAAGPTFSLGHTKALLNSRAPLDLTAALRAEADSVEATLRSADFKEGLRAFAERRDPNFVGY